MTFDSRQLAATLADHGPVTRVVIARLTGSSPRDVGTSMLVWDQGQYGTIGGGALEFQAAHRARSGFRGAMNIPLGPTLGQCCGGHVTLIFERFASLQDVPPDAVTFERDVPVFGSFSEPMIPVAHPVWLWGAGHVGRAVAEVVHDIPGLAVTWADTGLDRFPPHPPAQITMIPALSLPNLMSHAPKDASHLIFTYAHDLDLALCHAALTHGFRFCGLIGSQTKWARFRSRLRSLGHTEDEIDRITCPIGDPSLGKHPKMIALGVAQQIVSVAGQLGDIWGEQSAATA
ncbi:MAG: xanthine dehydrogenase accessory protein XdhC [Pseudomonadota bacterium]